MTMIVQGFTVGWLTTNCYLVSCERTREAIIVDPGFDNRSEAEKIFKLIEENALKLKLIVDTHGHPDHTCGNGLVKERFHTPILIHEKDAHMLGETGERISELFNLKNSSPPADNLLRDGDLVNFGQTHLKVMHTPGHSSGSVSLLGEKEVFSGDTLFAGSIGRTDLPGSSAAEMKKSLQKLAHLPEHFLVYPGHGPSTTIGEEKQSNPFFQSF
jgi:glyoxylase-like metal-dependent hydrolase (beta-lactamase superfamily II)